MTDLHDIASLRALRPEDELKHELKVHLGLVQDSSGSSGFDPTEFQTSPSATVASATVTDAPLDSAPAPAAAAVAVAETELPTSGETESMADDDFLNELRNLSS